ncbi:YTH domain-containing protein ECT4-like isoform X2 [Dioscorea cayenensis subsp. rotundata]|uniref:YTH domain-containing family protein n=1 Tax=Dioscorea cayennensis subsp. rotundata TaxID=55577 RepID=A0AB40CLU4_DIOCR|nr:YTH domain-containing protein ECT4-like isoform X2 [Dioscorea cayenensis subsp. rotundata]
MAAVAPAADQATDLLQKLSLDSKKKTHDAPEVTKKASADGGEVTSVQIPSGERSVTPLLQDCVDQSMWYPSAYYYGGYEGLINEWEDYPRYVNPDGVEVPPPGVYGDMYQHGYGYPSYGPYPSPGSPVPTMGHDGQLYGPPHYQYTAQYYQPPTPPPTTGAPNKPATSQGGVSTTVATEKPAATVDTSKGNSNGIANGKSNGHISSGQPRPNHQNSSLPSNGSYGRGILPGGLPSGYQDPRFGFDGMRSPIPWYDCPAFTDGQQRTPTTSSAPSAVSHVANNPSGRNQILHPLPHLMGLHTPRPASGMGPAAPGFVNRMYTSNRIYGQYGQCGTAFRTGLGFGSNGYDYRMNGRWGSVTDNKYKPRGRGNGFYGYGSENLDGLSELNRGPRGGRLKNTKGFGPNITIAVKGQNLSTNGNVEEASAAPARDHYNRDDFPEKYSDAKCFVIKSYSEDDIHKSVKYSVWASTPNGNKKLDAAYQEAQKVADGCPVFLFFSVNTSGQFVGIAEMAGPVDFNKTVDYWQQDKWNGCFPVKWHIVKDVPNSILKHITLENNDNKPVTNSRDTQEVKLEQGIQMLKIFKEHVSKTSILDDFAFYETRQKAMQEKNLKIQQIHKQVSNVKAADAAEEKEKIAANGKPRLQKPLEVVSLLKKEAVQSGQGEQKPPEENGVAGDVLKASKSVTEKHVVANGVANTC